MSFLNAMKEKKKELLIAKHPLCNEDLRLREVYATGVAVLMEKEDELLNDAEIEHLKELTFALSLTDDPVERISTLAKEATVDIFDTIVSTLFTIDIKYMFILDLYKAARIDSEELKNEEQEMIDNFADMLNLKKVELEFLKIFSYSIRAKDNVLACKALSEAYNNNLDPSFCHLKYFFNDLDYWEKLHGVTLNAGDSLMIKRPTVVDGEIIVKNGAELLIDGATVVLENDANIYVFNANISITNSTIIAGKNKNIYYLIYIFETDKVEFSSVEFIGNGMVPLLFSNATQTILTECKFVNSHNNSESHDKTLIKRFAKKGSAVTVASDYFSLNECIFENCYADEVGGAVYTEKSFFIKKCKFINCKSKYQGGAIFGGSSFAHNFSIINTEFDSCSSMHSSSIKLNCNSKEDEIVISDCSFKNCTASAYGKTIDTNRGKIENNKFNNCYPDKLR